MDEEDHAFFDDDFDETGKSAPLKSSSTNETNGKSKPSLFQIHCDLHGSSNRLTTTEKEQQQQQHKSYNTDDSSDDSESSDDDLFTPKSSEKSLTKPYDKEDYERDISKRSNSPFVLSSSDSDDNDDDDDTLTDVSPRSSPEASPNMKRSFRYSFSEEDDENGQRRRRRAKKEFPVISSDEDEQQQAVKHITKLNVTFKRDNEEKQQRFDEVTRGNTRKTKLQRNRKRHKGQGDALAIDHIEGSLSRYFEKDDSKTASSNRPKSSHHHHRTNPVRPLHMVDNNNQTTEVSDGYKTIDFEEHDGGGDSDKSTVDLNHLLEIILDLEEKGVNVKEKYKEQSSRRQESRQQKQRKNLSFSNDKAREIERENNRLFKEITKSSSSARSSRPGSSNSVRSRQSARSNASSRTSTTTMSSGRSRSRTQQVTTAKPYHSAVNRVNLQRQIERENMQILKRLQDAKPTATLQRTNQLREYHRQTKYMASTASPPTSAGRHRRRYEELARDPDVIQQALDIGERRFRQIRPAWQDVW